MTWIPEAATEKPAPAASEPAVSAEPEPAECTPAAPAPVITFSAWSGTGKTTVIEQLVLLFKQKGLRVAVIKHDAHEFEIDREGKDSWRFSKAGADMTILSSQQKTALIEQRSLSLSQVLSMVHDVDLILVEGYNGLLTGFSQDPGTADSVAAVSEPGDFPESQRQFLRIGLRRNAAGKDFRTVPSDCTALMSDTPVQGLPAGIPVFDLNDIRGLAGFLLDRLHLSES